MKFFDHMSRRWLNANARFWGKECARLMVLGALLKKHEHGPAIPTYAWLARKAMLARPHWQQVGLTTMLYERSGETIEIPEDTNLRFAIHAVIDVEYRYEVDRVLHLPPWEAADMIREAHAAAHKYLAEKTNPSPSGRDGKAVAAPIKQPRRNTATKNVYSVNRFCNSCGKPVYPGALFCSACGGALPTQ